MTGRWQDLEPAIAREYALPRPVHHRQLRPPLAQRRQPFDVIWMPMGDQHAHQRCAIQGARHHLHVFRLSDTGVDERGFGAEQQPRVVAGRPGPLGRVADQDGCHESCYS